MVTAGSMFVHHGRIWTGCPDRPWARSVHIDAGRIVALDGSPPPTAAVIDAAGGTVVPGLIDAHVHLLMGGRGLADLDLSAVRSRAAFEAAIAERHRALPADEWLIAHGWSEERFDERDMPDRSWLAAAGNRPTVCYRHDIHAVVVNDAVLERCDLSSEPDGGRIARDGRGTPTGLMVEAAAWHIVNPVVPARSVAQRVGDLHRAQAECHHRGLTAVGTMEYGRDLREILTPHRDTLTLRCAVTLLDRAWPLDPTPGAEFDGDDRLSVVGYKAFIDGTLGSRTARMLEPYDDAPDQRGTLLELAADGHLFDWARGVAAVGLSPSMHAIGDEAVRMALDVIDAVGRDAHPRLEHAQHVHLDDVARFGGVIASMQPLHLADDGAIVKSRLGEHRLPGTLAFRSLEMAGARLAFGSDWPVVTCDPMAGMRTAVTGVLADGTIFPTHETVSVETALHAYTTGAAHALRLDAGAIRPGALGDLTVLDRDPFAADWLTAPPVVTMTVAGGRVVYDAAHHGREEAHAR